MTAPDPLRALAEARPDPAVEHRIAEGAMARAMAPRRPVWPLLAAAAAAAGVALWWGSRAQPTLPTLPEIRVATGVRYQVTQGADAAFQVARESQDQTVVELSSGTATFAVEPLPPGGEFAVETPHGRVEVVGTRFSVTVEARCTRVDVAEGTVRVRREADAFLVPAGQSRSICKGGLEGEAVIRAALDDLAAGRVDAGRGRLEGYLVEQPRGLFAEDALFHLALLARREGDAAGARLAIDRFLARFPTGHRADRLRALRPAP
ncbi:MAG: FecR domain-containing protein [Myxococcales bacterium]|nr:FecR domain-containing protein [Myxococcales bacterium]